MKHIILVGMRGSGKSHAGRMIARKLGLPFIDMDIVIQHQAGMSIETMVEQHGWDFFRNLEHEVLRHLEHFRPAVIATGGGLPTFERNQLLLKNMGAIIWMHAPLPLIIHRLQQSKATHRPSLTGKNMIEELGEIYKEREPIYKKVSQFTFSSEKPFEIEMRYLLFFLKKRGYSSFLHKKKSEKGSL